jgi:DNA polymerase-1
VIGAEQPAPDFPALAAFEEIWLVDFEFVSKPGERPDVVCLVAHELRTGRTIRLRRDQMGASPPYRTDAGALFVCFVANAELACHLALDWPLPVNVLDLSPVFRCIVNGRNTPNGKSLLGALAYYCVDSIGAKLKDAMRERIMKGFPFTPEEWMQILDYCESDVVALAKLLPRILQDPDFDLAIALHWGETVGVSAQMEHRGPPIDMEVYSQLRDKRAWAYVRDAVVPAIDAQYGVYVKDAGGEWHFSNERFEALCARLGIDWPRHPTGKLDLRTKTLESMAKAYPQLEDLRQLRYARNKMRKIKLAVGSDGRNRTTLWMFAAKTARTQPKASEWIFSPAVWLRSLIKPGPGRAIAYIDWSSMEFMVAGALSGCRQMVELYATGSPYIEFAKKFDAAPQSATKKTHEDVHDTYKIVLLGAQYQMQHVTLARRLGISTFAAHEMLAQHRGLFNQYWAWTEDWIALALDTGVMRTPLGWKCHTGITELNARSIGNWIIQATSADIMRIACVMAARRGIELIGSVHDALVIEAPIERIDADVALTREAMRRASRIVLGGGYELRTHATIVCYPDRYSDKRGVKMWDTVMDLLEQYREREREAANKERRPAS